MANEKTHLEVGKVVRPEGEKEEDNELQFLMSKDKTVQRLRECAETVMKASPAINIPDNSCRLEQGVYTGSELGAVIYFIADMLE